MSQAISALSPPAQDLKSSASIISALAEKYAQSSLSVGDTDSEGSPSVHQASTPSPGWTFWKSRRPGRMAKDSVRNTLRHLVAETETQFGSSSIREVEDVLRDCAEACEAHSISFASILQDRYIDKHSPLYWAVTKTQPIKTSRDSSTSKEDAPFNLLAALLPFSLPITNDRVISELRRACMFYTNSDAFQRLRIAIPKFSSYPPYWSLSETPDMNKSDVKVMVRNDVDGDAFSADIKFPHFHERLSLSRLVGVEFVVHNRIWQFSLSYRYVERHSSSRLVRTWSAELSVRDSSPETWFSGYLILIIPSSSSRAKSPRAKTFQSDGPSSKVDPVRMGTDDQPLQQRNCIWTSLEGSHAFSSLQHADSIYVAGDGTLSLRLEGRLVNNQHW